MEPLQHLLKGPIMTQDNAVCISTPTTAGMLRPGTYGWLPDTPGNPRPWKTTEGKLALAAETKLQDSYDTTGALAHRITRRTNGSYEITLVPFFKAPKEIMAPDFTRERPRPRTVTFDRMVPETRYNHYKRRAAEARKNHRAVESAKETGLALLAAGLDAASRTRSVFVKR